MRTFAISVLVGLMTVTSINTTSAADCGFPPMDKPSVPNGKTDNRTVINATIGSLKAYGEGMNKYLDCMTENQDGYFNNMNKKQQERWIEDFNVQAEGLEELQNAINREIRLFNLTNKSTDDEAPKTN
jgi:hypothetical protein